MTPRIQQLSAAVVNQIAAGEVIERPASVVKELLENSADAGSTRIEIDIEQGGQDLIRIVDDGCGIAPDDLPLAFAPHATSKLRHADDLFRVGTFGFRGEALASIGGVAHVVLQSRPPSLQSGSCVEVKGSILSEVRPWSGAPGTRIEVRQLFFNTPVRRRFLRTAATEAGHVSEAVIRLALAHPRTEEAPGLHLVLRHNGRVVHDIPSSYILRDRIGKVFGEELLPQLYEVEGEAGPVHLTGFVADPASDRGNPRMQYLFVNGRWVRDRSLGHAVQEAYRGLLMTGRYPISFVFLKMPADQVDVNVHPQKCEVRFRHAQSLHHLIFTAVKARLRKANLVPRFTAPTLEPTAPTGMPRPAPFVLTSDPPPAPTLPFAAPRWTAPTSPAPSVPPITQLRPALPEMRPPVRLHETPKAIQLYDCYLVLETPEGMLVIDQHALHERILFGQYSDRIKAGTLESQPLLIPEPVELEGEAAGRLLEVRDSLGNLGLGIEPFGGSTVLLTRYPALLGKRSPSNLLKAVADHLLEQDRLPPPEVMLNSLLSLMACHSAVRAGERLPPEQVADLLEQRERADDHHHCPHGRPTALLFTKHDLERQFRRA